MGAGTIIAIIGTVITLFISLGTIIFKLGVSNRKLEELVTGQREIRDKLQSLETDLNKLKLKLAGKIEGVSFE